MRKSVCIPDTCRCKGVAYRELADAFAKKNIVQKLYCRSDYIKYNWYRLNDVISKDWPTALKIESYQE